MTDIQPQTTLRTYRFRVTAANVALIITVAAVAFYFYWSRTTMHTLLGVLHTVITLRLIEKVINTTYLLTPEGELVINRGRFSRRKVIPLNEILSARTVALKPFMTRVVLIEYGAHHVTSVQPQDCDGFVRELKKRQNRLTEAILGGRS